MVSTDVKHKRLFSIHLYQFAYVACMLVIWWHVVKCVPYQVRLDQLGSKFWASFEHAQNLERTSNRKGLNWLCSRHLFYALAYLMRFVSCTYQSTSAAAALLFGGPWVATDFYLTCNGDAPDGQHFHNGWVTCVHRTNDFSIRTV